MADKKTYRVEQGGKFTAWFEKLKKTRKVDAVRVDKRIEQIEAKGLFGPHRNLGGGLWELKFEWGPGYRVYYIIIEDKVVFLLSGGIKTGQEHDIELARKLAKEEQNEENG